MLPEEFKFVQSRSNIEYDAVLNSGKYDLYYCGRTCLITSVSVELAKKYIESGLWLLVEPDKKDPIKPTHYHRNEIDVHGYLQKHFPKQGSYTVAEGFHIGNVIKYVSRYKDKNGLEDLKKAEANLKVLIEMEEKTCSK